MRKVIAISSGKGGTGKTFVSTHLSHAFVEIGGNVRYLDCDVEEPNGHLFLKVETIREKEILLLSPISVDKAKCIMCKKCVQSCKYNAISSIKDKILIFKNLCHVCGACMIVCPVDAIIRANRKIGVVKHGKSGEIELHYGLLETGEGGMTPRLIQNVKENIADGINILDSPPGTSCPVVATVKNSDITILVTDPTPFGINDLKLSVDMCRQIGQEPVIVINRSDEEKEALINYCANENLKIIGEIPDDRRIAECYSEGEMIFDKLPEYHEVFSAIAGKIIEMLENCVCKRLPSITKLVEGAPIENVECNLQRENNPEMKEIVVISGKGGTGKTSLTACFCAIENEILISDCDVDAADLHLVLKPEIIETGKFSGGEAARINNQLCNSCGKCFEFCKFGAVSIKNNLFEIEELTCEGCGVCTIVCAQNAITTHKVVNGEWYVSRTKFGIMSHAKLFAASENSGRLVTLVRDKKNAYLKGVKYSIIDGSPGTGCPVISSITGTDYSVIVTEPTVSGIHDLERILDLIEFFRLRSGVIVNKYDINPEKSKVIREIAKKRKCDFLGEINYDSGVTQAQKKGLTFIEWSDGSAAKQIRKIWERIKLIVNEN